MDWLNGAAAVATVMLLVFAGTLRAPSPAVAQATCDVDAASAGAWNMYGGDVEATRHQRAETAITHETVGDLSPAWTFTTGSTGTKGWVANTTVVGDCVFFTDEPAFGQAYVYAIRVGTGELVWKVPALPGVTPDVSGRWASTASAPTVVDGRLHINVTTPAGPDGQAAIGAAFDPATGARLWTGEPISFGYTTNSMSAPTVWGGVHITFTIGPDADNSAREGYALLDAASGETLFARTTLPPEAIDAGFAGGGAWTTPAVDPLTGYAFVGTSNPGTSMSEHAYDNAILKIDIARERDGEPNPSFGQIVDSYKGDPDNYLTAPITGGYDNALCQTAGPLWPLGGFNIAFCSQHDVDFGGSPSLVRTEDGRVLIAEMQKSGTFHMVDAETMEPLWRRPLTTTCPCYQGNLAPAANDGRTVYVTTNPGVLVAVDALTGETIWSASIGGEVPHHPVTLAGGVVYVINNYGVLLGYHAGTGELLLSRSLTADTGIRCGEGSTAEGVWSAAVTIVDGTLYATCDQSAEGGYVVAYRVADSPDPVGASTTVVSGPAASSVGFLTADAVVPMGGTLSHTNLDPTGIHNVVSVDRGSDRRPLFASALTPSNETRAVEGVSDLPRGTYAFFCGLHGGMRGQLTVM